MRKYTTLLTGCYISHLNRNRMAKKKEAVNHPDHYGGEDNPYEVVKVIEAWKLCWHLGSAVKYIPRAGKKDKTKYIEDLEKSIWYIKRKIKQLKSQ